MTSIYAYTETQYSGPYPSFISINRRTDGQITISVRAYNSKGKMEWVEMLLPETELTTFAAALMNKVVGDKS